MTNNTRAQLLKALLTLKPFVSEGQLIVMAESAGASRFAKQFEESEFFQDLIFALADRINRMPKTYEQNGKGDNAIAYLHYCRGAANWYITEKDKGSENDEVRGLQNQAYGNADLYKDGGERGYISIQELIDNGVELDLYWEPKTLKECGK